jgi:hypothetical protein
MWFGTTLGRVFMSKQNGSFVMGDHLGILTIEKVVYYKTIADSWR